MKFIHAILPTALITLLLATNLAAADSSNDTGALLLSLEGKVEVAATGTSDWKPGATNEPLHVGDRLRTGLRARATVRLSNLTVLRVNELTTLQIQPPSAPGRQAGLDLKNGSTYFLSRERGNETEFRTPLASGAIRGTEFNLAVTDDGRSEVTLIDGAVTLANNLGTVDLNSGEQGVVENGQPPRKSPFIDAINIIQWALYYPGVIDADGLDFSDEEKIQFAESLAAYRAGDLITAREKFPDDRSYLHGAKAVYQAQLELSAGQLGHAEHLPPSPQADALLELIAAVKNQPRPSTINYQLSTSSLWLAESYFLQSQLKLADSLAAARNAATTSPNFGFAWARVAELEFSFGHTAAALEALEKSLQLSPRNAQAVALKGFLLAAQNKIPDALAQFSAAIALDPALANAWLGRGLCKIKRGDSAGGIADLQVAATLEPHRAVLRSYLGKAFANGGDPARAAKELQLAQKFDPNDPTSWLYSALLSQQENKVNDAVHDLEKSQSLNDNRKLFRSRLLLDQDRAVRGANLAGVYQDAGMTDVSVREASRAVNSDYANFSAHQFLAGSYDKLRDPKGINARYDAPWLSELLLANLLAPVGAGSLAQNISQQEYSKLFERDRLGIFSSTEYQSSGAWIQEASQFGTLGNSSYAMDVDHRSDLGQRRNNDNETFSWWFKFKQQVAPSDNLFLQVQGFEAESGDVNQYYNQLAASPLFRAVETQRPNVALGWHHEWSPGMHTLFLFERLDDTLSFHDRAARIPFVKFTGANVSFFRSDPFKIDYRRDFNAYSTELQHIWQTHANTLVAGARFQSGTMDVFGTVDNLGNTPSGISTQNVSVVLQRISLYAYDTFQICDSLQLIGGVSYDRLRSPRNIDLLPVNTEQDDTAQISPKAGLLWQLTPSTHVRAAYTRSLGGVSVDSSHRLEPSQVAGFNQALRSVAPESAVGIASGTHFETFGLGLEHEFNTGTYLTLEAELLRSDVTRTYGVVTNRFLVGGVADSPSSTRQRVQFEEQTLRATVNQLVGRDWSFGARYQLSYARLNTKLVDATSTARDVSGINQIQRALMNQLNLFAIYNHPSGFFARAESVWTLQSNIGYTPDIAGDEFWQFNIFAGWRFWHRAAEVSVGILNLTDRDYQLNPLNLYNELPRERTFMARCKFYF